MNGQTTRNPSVTDSLGELAETVLEPVRRGVQESIDRAEAAAKGARVNVEVERRRQQIDRAGFEMSDVVVGLLVIAAIAKLVG